jgi:hypothetical protein
MKYAVTVERVRWDAPSDRFDGTELPAGPGVRYVTIQREGDDRIAVDAAVALVDGEPRVIGAEVFVELAEDGS